MKRVTLAVIIIAAAAFGLIYADSKTDDGLMEELRILITPDPMENNTYDEGECTYYVFDKVQQDGMMIERSWSNAEYWADRAEEDGYVVNDVPETGALMQTGRGEIGHVAYIESVNDDGSFNITEMNFLEPYEVTERTIDEENTGDYQYIHPKVNKHADRE